MTAWTAPTTWSSGNTPTAANLNAQIRDNMLHLRERGDGLGYAYVTDPRINLAGTTANPGVYYMRGWGRCVTVRAIRMRVTVSAGTQDVGFYTNVGEGMAATPAYGAVPATLKDSATESLTPAIGLADVLMTIGTVEFNPGDWFAYGPSGGTQAIYYSGLSTMGGGRGWSIGGSYQLAGQATPVDAGYVSYCLLAIP